VSGQRPPLLPFVASALHSKGKYIAIYLNCQSRGVKNVAMLKKRMSAYKGKNKNTEGEQTTERAFE